MPPKTAKLALALLATSALGVSALEIGTGRAARTELQRYVAAHQGVTVGRIEASPLSGHVTLYGVVLGAGQARVSIGALRLPVAQPSLSFVESAAASPFDDAPAKSEATPDDTPAAPAAPDAPAAPAPEAAAPAAGNTASADDVVITSSTTTFHIKRIDLAGTPLSNADLAAILDPKSTTSLSDRLKTLTAASIVIPEVTADDVTPDHESHWTEHQILLANVVAGRVAEGSAASTSIAVKDSKSATNGTLGAIVASGIDIAQLLRVFGTTRTDDSEALVPLMDSVTIDGGQFADVGKNSTVSFGPIKETGFKGRPLKVKPSEVKSDDSEASKRLADDAMRSFALSSFELANFAFEATDTKDKLTLASLSMNDFDASKVGGIKASALNYAGESAKVSIGSINVGAFKLPRSATDPAVSGQTDVAFGQTDFNDIAVTTTTAATDPSKPATPIQVGLKHVGFVSEATPAGAPRQASMSLDNLTFDVPPDSGAQPLIDMGYLHLDVSGKTSSSYDAPAQGLAVKEITVSGVGMGTVSLGFDLANVGPSVFSSNIAEVKVAALAILLKDLDLKVDNAGIVDKALAWQAKSSGETLEQARARFVDNVTTKIPMALGNGANAKAIGAAAGKFLAAPKTLHIHAASKSGLGVADMALINTPDVLLDSLDVTATANE